MAVGLEGWGADGRWKRNSHGTYGSVVPRDRRFCSGRPTGPDPARSHRAARHPAGEQYIKVGKPALNWTRRSCDNFADNQVRLQLFTAAAGLLALKQASRALSCYAVARR